MQDAANVCQKFMIRDPDEIHFTIVALAAAQWNFIAREMNRNKIISI